MKIDEIRTRLEGIAGFFAARADMAAPGDGKLLMLAWMRAAKEAAALLGVETVPAAGAGRSGGDMVHVTLALDGKVMGETITPYVDGNMAAKEAAALLGVETVPAARIREMMIGDDAELSKAARMVMKELERRETDAGRGDQDRGER